MSDLIPGRLDLTTLVDVPDIGVRIDGVDYLYSPHWRWSLLERSRFGTLYSEMLKIERKEGQATERDQKRFTDIQTELCQIVAPELPVEVIRALPSDGQRSALIIDFLTKSGTQAATLIPKEHAAMLSLINTSQIGVSSSRDSRRSMGVVRRNGSTSPGPS